MRSDSLSLSLVAMFLIACVDNTTAPVTEPGPQIGETEFVSVEFPDYERDPHSEGPDKEWNDVLHLTRVQGEHTFVVSATRFQGVKVLDVTDASNPTVVSTLPLEGRVLAIHDVGDWVVVVGRSEVVVIDATELAAPTITGKTSFPDYLSKSVLFGEGLGLLMTNKVVTVSISNDGQPTASMVELDSNVAYATSNIEHLVVVERVFPSQSPTTSENNVTSPESARLTVFDSQGRHGSVTVEGPLVIADVRGNVLRVAFQATLSRVVVRTFDISDPTNIQTIASETICCAPIFVPDGMVTGGFATRIDDDGQFGTPQPSTMVLPQHSWRLVDEGRRILVVESTSEIRSPGQISARLYNIEDLGQTAQIASTELSGLGKYLRVERYHVAENAVSVLAEDGTEETGLIVVPYTERPDSNEHQGALRLFTFSSSTVTVRGEITMYADVELEPIRLSTNIVGILTGGEIRAYDLLDPATPQEVSVLEVAPTVTNIFEFGNFLVRRHKDFNYNMGATAIGRLTDRLAVVPADDIHGTAVATLDVPIHAMLRKVGHSLVVFYRDATNPNNSVIDVWNMSNPLAPEAAPGLVRPDFSHNFSEYEASTNAYRSGPRLAIYQLDDALVFAERIRTQISHSESGPAQSWATVKLHVLDLSDPADPKFGPVVDIGSDERVVSIIADGRKLHVTTWVPWQIAGDDQAYIRHYFLTVDYSNLGSPTTTDSVNVPGRVLNVNGDSLATVNGVLAADGRVDATINRLRLGDGVATLEAFVRMEDRDTHDVRFVAGHLLVSHTERWDEHFTLDIITFPALEIASQTVIVGDWMYVVGSSHRHMVYSGQGVVAVDVESPASPTVHTETRWVWDRQMIELGDQLLIAAGRDGIIALGGSPQ